MVSTGNSFGLLKKKKKMALSTKLFIAAGLFFPLFHFVVFWCGININGILLAFQSKTVTGVTQYGFQNFRMILDEIKNPYSNLRNGVGNTFIFFFFNLLVQMPLCYIVSFFIYKKVRGYNVFKFIYFLPAIISDVVTTSFVKFMAAPGGPLPEVWNAMFGIKPMFFQDSRFALPSMLVYMIWSGFGLSLILYTAAFNRIPHDLIEVGQLEGLGLLKEIRYILFPLTWPFFSTMIMLACTGIFGASGPILLFTQGAYGTYTISYWIYDKTVNGGNAEFAAAFGLVLTLLAFPLIILLRWLADKVEPVEY